MPPKKSTGAAAPAACSIEKVGHIFQEVHRSAAHAQRCRKEIVALGDLGWPRCVGAVCGVVLLVLKQATQLTSDAQRRHYTFLLEISKASREASGSDDLPVEVMRTVLPFHNANEKSVRLAVVSTFEALLKTVDQSNSSEERQDFYQDAAEMLKRRVHDKCPKVREASVGAVAAFQTGKKDCDVTQQLIALLCTDTHADVRRQVLRCVAPRKEFLEGYFHGMIRCTRDTVARVRAEAWDALARFPWRYITAYASAKNVKLPELLMQGLRDTNTSVFIACRAALTNCWLHRDCKDECGPLLDPIACGYVLRSLDPFDVICNELLLYVRKRKPGHHFILNLQDMNTPALLMWKLDCKVTCDTEGDDETVVLLPLEQFAGVLQDTVYAYARPDTPLQHVAFRTVEDADNMLRILMSAFEIYEENGNLAFADNTRRGSFLRIFSFLLKVVPDDDPSLFVSVAVRCLRSLTARTPEEATKTVTAALDSLFRSLKLPQQYALGFDDVEALARRSRERRQELVRRRVLVQGGGATQEYHDELKDEMDRDEKFLLRMQLIVLYFLSHSQRGEAVPAFCSHVIQLGRQQDNEQVQAIATKSLGLQCLINPDSVHTFMPLLLGDAAEKVSSSEDVALPLSAMGVCFDFIMEYGLKFFDTAARRSGAVYNPDNTLEARLQHEQELAEEDVHKVGSKRLLFLLSSYLAPECTEKHSMAICGFCKLLSCNRIPSDRVTEVLAPLLVHYAVATFSRKEDAASAYMALYCDTFFRSYSSSHPRRQEDVAIAGVAAFRALMPHSTAIAGKLLEYVIRAADAFTLTQVRDIDPETARRVHKAAAAAEEEEEGGGGGGSSTRDASARSTATRSSMQSGRLLRELSRHSLHERIAEDLLLLVAECDSLECAGVCVTALEQRMYFYSKDPQPLLRYCGRRAARALAAIHGGDDLSARLEKWLDSVDTTTTSSGGEVETNAMEKLWTERTSRHTELQKTLLENGFGRLDAFNLSSVAFSPVSSASQTFAVKEEAEDGEAVPAGKHAKLNDPFDVASIAGPQRKRARY